MLSMFMMLELVDAHYDWNEEYKQCTASLTTDLLSF